LCVKKKLIFANECQPIKKKSAKVAYIIFGIIRMATGTMQMPHKMEKALQRNAFLPKPQFLFSSPPLCPSRVNFGLIPNLFYAPISKKVHNCHYILKID